MLHRWSAALAACAGVWLLVGPGWALLTAAAALYLLAPATPQADAAAGATLAARVAAAAHRVRDAGAREPRRTTAVVSMTAAVVALPVGALLLAGSGAAALTAGGVAVGLSLLTGWNA